MNGESLGAGALPAAAPAGPLSPAQAEFIRTGGVSVNVASGGAELRPSQARAVGCLIAPDCGSVSVMLRRSQSETLLRDIAASGRVAVVCCQPSTHRTLQIKGDGAVVRPAADADHAELARQCALFHQQLAPLAYTEAFTHALLDYAPDDLVEVSFIPRAVFSQTPGPRAGERVS
jgi:hypothetical protein